MGLSKTYQEGKLTLSATPPTPGAKLPSEQISIVNMWCVAFSCQRLQAPEPAKENCQKARGIAFWDSAI